MNEQEQWQELGQQLRVGSVRAAAAAGIDRLTIAQSVRSLVAAHATSAAVDR